MSEVWNVGKDVISAYLSGLQHKERREALVNQALYRQQQMQIAAEKIDEGRKQFLEKHKLDTEKFKLDQDELASADALRKAQMNKIGYDIRRGGLDILGRAKDLVGKNGQPLDLNAVLDPTENAIRRKSTEQINQEAATQAGAVTGAQTAAKQPFVRENIIQKGIVDAANDAANKAADAVQKQLDRESRERIARDRLAEVRANKDAKKEDKDGAVTEYVDSVKDDVFAWRKSKNDLASPTNELGMRAHGQLGKIGRVATPDNLIDVKLLHNVKSILGKAEALNEELGKNSSIVNSSSGKVAALKAEMDQDVETYARAEKGQKGVMTDKDRPVIEGGLVQINPLGKSAKGVILSALNPAEVKAANNRRMDTIRKLYNERIDMITAGMTPTQRKAVMDQYNLPEKFELTDKKDNTKKSLGVGGSFTDEQGHTITRTK